MSNRISTYNQLIARFKVFAEGHYFIKADEYPERFTHGQIDVKDLAKMPSYPCMHVAPNGVDFSNGSAVWRFTILVFDLPRQEELKTDYQKELISDLTQVIQDLGAEIKNGRTLFGRDAEMNEFTVTPFMEEQENVVTGVQAEINITLSYQWDACSLPATWASLLSQSQSESGGSGLVIRVNGEDTAIQNILDLVDGSGMTITDLGDGRISFVSSGGGGGASTWGSITGTLSNQTDLQNALNAKASTTALTSETTARQAADATLQTNIDDEAIARSNADDALQTAINGKEPSISSGTTSQYWRGDKSWQTLDKSAVGLGNADNTSDVNKPVSTAQAAADSAVASAAATDSTTKANAAQAFAIQRANHTGTQVIATISDATTVGQNLVKLTNPSAVRYLQVNADNTVTALTALQLREALGRVNSIKSGNQNNTVTQPTTESITGLSCSLLASATYRIRVVMWTGCNNTGGLRIGATFPTGATVYGFVTGTTTAASAQIQTANTLTSGSLLGTQWNAFNNQNGFVEFECLVVNGVNAGTFQMIFAGNTAGQTSTIYGGSNLVCERTDA